MKPSLNLFKSINIQNVGGFTKIYKYNWHHILRTPKNLKLDI